MEARAQDEELRIAIGARLREWRLSQQRSQHELASAVGIKQASLSNYELGRRDMTLLTAMRLAVALGTSLAALVQGLENISV